MKKKLSVLFLTAVFTLLFATAVGAATAPDKVGGLKQTDAKYNSVTIECDPVLGEYIRYEISMSSDGTNWRVVNKSAYSTKTSIDSLSSGKTYYVKVRAFENYDDVYGDYSNVIEVVTSPDVVKGLVQTGATTSSITLKWNTVSGATGYRVCKQENGQEYVLGTTDKTTFTISKLNNKNKISFSNVYVRAIKASKSYTAVDTRGYYYFDYISEYKLRLVPAKVTNVHISNYYRSLNEVNLAFDSAEHTDGCAYEIYDYSGKKVTSGTGSATGNSFIKNIKVGKFYKARVRAYANVNGKACYGEWSGYTYFAQSPKAAPKLSKKKLSVKWNKVKGATSYSVYVSTNSKAGYKKVKTTKKTSASITKLGKKKISKKKTYYVYVVANKKVGKVTYKSPADYYYYMY